MNKSKVNNFKIAMILIGIMIAYFVIIIAFASSRSAKMEGKDKDKNKQQQTQPDKKKEEKPIEPEQIIGDYTLIFDDKKYLSYKDGTWFLDNNYEYSNKLTDIYVDNSLFGNFYINYGGYWSVFDANRDFKTYEGIFMGVYTTNDLEYKVLTTSKNELNETDNSIIIEYLNNKGISFDNNLINKSKYIVDVDRDGLRDTIYFVSDAFSDSPGAFSKSFAFGFVKYANNKEDTFYEYEESIDNLILMGNPELQTIIEIDGVYYMIVNNNYYSNEVKYLVYSVLNDSIFLRFETE